MTKILAIIFLVLLNLWYVYYISVGLLLLDNSVNGFLIPSSILESGGTISIGLRWIIALIEMLVIFAVFALINFGIFEKIRFSKSRSASWAIFIVQSILVMSFVTYYFISIASSVR